MQQGSFAGADRQELASKNMVGSSNVELGAAPTQHSRGGGQAEISSLMLPGRIASACSSLGSIHSAGTIFLTSPPVQANYEEEDSHNGPSDSPSDKQQQEPTSAQENKTTKTKNENSNGS